MMMIVGLLVHLICCCCCCCCCCYRWWTHWSMMSLLESFFFKVSLRWLLFHIGSQVESKQLFCVYKMLGPTATQGNRFQERTKTTRKNISTSLMSLFAKEVFVAPLFVTTVLTTISLLSSLLLRSPRSSSSSLSFSFFFFWRGGTFQMISEQCVDWYSPCPASYLLCDK